MFHGFEKEKCKCNKWKAVTGFLVKKDFGDQQQSDAKQLTETFSSKFNFFKRISSHFTNDCICIELLVYLFDLFLNSNLFDFVTGTKVVVVRTALSVRAMQKPHLAGCNY